MAELSVLTARPSSSSRRGRPRRLPKQVGAPLHRASHPRPRALRLPVRHLRRGRTPPRPQLTPRWPRHIPPPLLLPLRHRQRMQHHHHRRSRRVMWQTCSRAALRRTGHTTMCRGYLGSLVSTLRHLPPSLWLSPRPHHGMQHTRHPRLRLPRLQRRRTGKTSVCSSGTRSGLSKLLKPRRPR
ncbi:hypothetical protein K466DRAFT_1252 [Polyporus arcularius HHB13444]|uniref:Uncharacterized protein n=1 Tax=Polyporus arcularius HHB13444 TaxID=1314778 RepID=A0A5C3PZ07_9APHY|nr:hypothetical protein K466DRAFT_1252 [Polyporus arcularius HHB13444]